MACPPRFATARNYDRQTIGPRIGEVARRLGTPFMPWQQYVADVLGEIDPETGLLWYREGIIIVPRQSGKTTFILAKSVHRARVWPKPQNIAYAAQTRNDARKKWEDDHVRILDGSLYGKRRLYRVRKTNGNEAILWGNGSRYGIVSTTEKSGHGPTLDEAYIDEAFAQPDGRLEQAFRPSMVTRPGPQMLVVSSAGRSPESSPYLWGKVDAGRARCEEGRLSSRIAYFEWSAGDDMDRADPATWWATMPALGHTITEDAIAADFEAMVPSEFDRAYLCRWNPHAVDTVIPEEDWKALGSSPGMLDPVSFAVDVTPDRAWASIAAVGDSAGDDWTVAAAAIADHKMGTSWVVPRLVELVERHGPKNIVVDPIGPAGSLLTAMEAAGLDITLASTRDHTQACGSLLDAVLDKTLIHEPHPMLDAAVAGASRRKVGDAWLWTRTGSTVDISPLVAVTLALWGHRRIVEDDADGQDFAFTA